MPNECAAKQECLDVATKEYQDAQAELGPGADLAVPSGAGGLQLQRFFSIFMDSLKETLGPGTFGDTSDNDPVEAVSIIQPRLLETIQRKVEAAELPLPSDHSGMEVDGSRPSQGSGSARPAEEPTQLAAVPEEPIQEFLEVVKEVSQIPGPGERQERARALFAKRSNLRAGPYKS